MNIKEILKNKLIKAFNKILEKKRSFFKKNFLATILFSYIGVLLWALLFTISIYTLAQKVIINNVIQTQIELMNNIKTTIDKEIETVLENALRIAIDSNIASCITNIQSGGDHIDSVITIQKILRDALLSNKIIDEVYLYLYKPNFVLSSKSKYYLKEFKTYLQNEKSILDNKFFNLLNAYNWKNLCLVRTKLNNPILMLIQSIPEPSYKGYRGVIIIDINLKRLSSIVTHSINTEKYIIGIIDRDNNCFLFGKNNFLGNVEFTYSLFSSNNRFFYLSNRKLGIVHLPSNNSNWEYFSIFSIDLILKEIHHFKNISFTYIIFCLVSTIIISIFLAKRAYNPIKKLLDKILDRVKQQNDNLEENELRLLDAIFEDIIEENERLLTEIKEKDSKLAENILIRLLKENVVGNMSHIYKVAEGLGKIEIFSPILLVGVSILNIEEKIFDVDKNEEEIEVAYSVVINAVNNILSEKYRYFCLTIDGKILYIITLSNDEMENFKNTIRDLIIYLKDFLIKNFGIHTAFAISNIHQSLHNLSLAYEEISSIFEYQEVSNNYSLLFYEDVAMQFKSKSSSCEDIMMLLKKIIECIMNNDLKELIRYNTEFFNKSKYYLQSDPHMYRLWTSTYKSIALGILNRFKSYIDLDKYNEVINKIQKTNNINVIKHVLENILNELLNIVEEREDKKPYWLGDVIEYIRLNYNSQQLCVSAISERFNISYEHLSRTFKKFIGVNISDYIHLLRLEKAKKMLEETNLTIKEIAEKVGY
ncbi:MAG: helix-turn-helix domain-containing protein, partial [Candidatus Methanomethyliaceae archaeon]